MAPYLRTTKTASGATAVQIAQKRDGRQVIIEHLGSAHDEAELALLKEAGRCKLHPGQDELDLGLDAAADPARARVVATSSRLLVEVIRGAYARLGFDVIGDEAFFQLVLARMVEPTSKADSVRVIRELGVDAVHRNTFTAALRRCAGGDYRDKIATACFNHAVATGGIALCLYDVTTLYFEADDEDDLRKVGYSKERRVDPQIVVGLLVDRSGFPLEISCFEGNQAETATLLPVITAFQDRHGIADMVVVADAGMLSASNLTALDEAGMRFIVGSRTTKAPIDLESHFHWHGENFTDGQIIDTLTPRRGKNTENNPNLRAEPAWDPQAHPGSWRAIWAYSQRRYARDTKNLTAQENRARDVINGIKAARTPRFVKTVGAQKSLDETALARARRLAGLKGYVTNIEAPIMDAPEVIASYHDLWHVEQSFRMSKSDLAARPIFHHTRETIEAHLTIVFTALAVARDLQARSGASLKKIIRTLQPLRDVTIAVAGHELTAEPTINDEAAEILRSLGY